MGPVLVLDSRGCRDEVWAVSLGDGGGGAGRLGAGALGSGRGGAQRGWGIGAARADGDSSAD